MCSPKTLLDKICEILNVSYGQEFTVGVITYRLETFGLMRKYPNGLWGVENFEKILCAVVGS